ncbi:hypothetical protein PHAVU_008G145700 [Phaseolus vulgaris]
MSSKGKMKEKEKEVWCGYRTVRKEEIQKPKQSYAEIVRKHSKGRWTGPAFEIIPNTPAWLASSAVGWMSSSMSFDTLNEEFVKGGMSRIKLRFMGDNLMLLTPKDGDRMEDIFKLNNEWFVVLFDDIKPWSESHVVEHKIVWCFKKVVGEVASLVQIDESTRQWENLEFARLQVRVRKACKVDMVKEYRINGQVCNVVITEEIPNRERGECLCHDDHYESSDSISSSDTVVEETYHAERLSDEGEEREDGGSRRDEDPEVVGLTQTSIPTNRKFLENKVASDTGCQSKGGFSFLKMAKRVQGGSEGGAALAAVSQVNEACKVFQESLANLIEGAYGCNFPTNGPKQGQAQSTMSGTVSKEGILRGPMSGSNGGKTVSRSGKEGLATMAASNPHPVHCSSERESSSTGSSDPQSSESVKWCKRTNGVESSAEHNALSKGEVGCKSSPEFRRPRSTGGMGTQNAQPKWRSNGGVGTLHHGVNPVSRLSHCSLAESSTDIHHCNDRLKLDVKDAESVRIWELGRNLGLECSGGEGNLVEELDRLEERDKDDKEVSWVGSVKELP